MNTHTASYLVEAVNRAATTTEAEARADALDRKASELQDAQRFGFNHSAAIADLRARASQLRICSDYARLFGTPA